MAGETLAADEQEVADYVKKNEVEESVRDVVAAILKEKPDNPREWLVKHLEDTLSNDTQLLTESDLHRLFAATRKITKEIVPQEAIESVIKETINLLNCDRVSLFVHDRKLNMLRLYASNLATPIMVSPGQGIAGCVFNTKDTVNIPDCYLDVRFDQSFDHASGYVTKSLIALPILDYEGSSVGVIQAINKLPVQLPEDQSKPVGLYAVPFGNSDKNMALHLAQHISIAMRNAEVYREAIATSERTTGLLNTIQSLSLDLGTQSMLLTITTHASKIVQSQRATVFILDEASEQLWSVSTDTGQEIRIPMHAGIAGQCCRDSTVINIPDAYADKRFNQDIDKLTGFKTQSILAIPMLEDDHAQKEMSRQCTRHASLKDMVSLRQAQRASEARNQVIGVIQMINKVSFDGQLECFLDEDIRVMELFAKFVGPKLAVSSMIASRRSESSGARKEAEIALQKEPSAENSLKRSSLKGTVPALHSLME